MPLAMGLQSLSKLKLPLHRGIDYFTRKKPASLVSA